MLCNVQGLDDIIELSWSRPQVFEEAHMSPVTLCQGHDQGDEAEEDNYKGHLLLPATSFQVEVDALALLQVVEDVSGGTGGVGQTMGGAAALTQAGVPVPAPDHALGLSLVVTLTGAPVGNINLNNMEAFF